MNRFGAALSALSLTLLAVILAGCATGTHGSTVDGKYSVPAIVTVADDVPSQLQSYVPKFGQVLGYYGFKLDKTDDPRAFQLHIAYTEASGDPKVSAWLTQNGKTVLEVFATPRRWVPWGWFTTPTDKEKLISGVADTAVQEFDNRMNDFMDDVRIDNEPREGEKQI